MFLVRLIRQPFLCDRGFRPRQSAHQYFHDGVLEPPATSQMFYQRQPPHQKISLSDRVLILLDLFQREPTVDQGLGVPYSF